MAKVTVQFLVGKPTKKGVHNWYWQPSKTLKDAGFTPVRLGQTVGQDASAEIIEAAQARNKSVEQWRQGEPLEKIRTRHQDNTFGRAIDNYRRDVVNGKKPNGAPMIAASTAKAYGTALKRLEAWGGDMPLRDITPKRVKVLRNAMLKPIDQGGIGHHPAHKTLKLGRQVFKYLISEDEWPKGQNPFEDFGLGEPEARDVVWSPEARELIVATADAMELPSIALAVMLGYAIGQREADILETRIPQYVELPAHKMQPADYEALSQSSPDGVPRGIRIRQNKTKAWIEVPVVGEVRDRVEANIKRSTTAGHFCIILDDLRRQSNRRIEQSKFGNVVAYEGHNGAVRFQRDFAGVREEAATRAEAEKNMELAEHIRTLQFRDLRRTCVVYLGELGLEDHLIAAITGHDIDETRKILKVYMPRTTGRAAAAVAIATARQAKEKRA